MFCHNKSAIDNAKNLVYHIRTLHIPIKHHFIQDVIEDGEVELKFCNSQYQVADIFIMAIPTDKFNYFPKNLGVQEQHNKGEYVEYCVIIL